MSEQEEERDGTSTENRDGAAWQLANHRRSFGREPSDEAPVISAGPRTPEELETLFEDALLLGDYEALVGLFERRSALVTSRDPTARGPAAIGRLALGIWHDAEPYIAASRLAVQVGDTTLIVTERGANVAHRGPDGTWRYTIFVEVGESQQKGTST